MTDRKLILLRCPKCGLTSYADKEAMPRETAGQPSGTWLHCPHQGKHGERCNTPLGNEHEVGAWEALHNRCQFYHSSPERRVLQLLYDEEITESKAAEWLREFINDGVVGPLPTDAPSRSGSA